MTILQVTIYYLGISSQVFVLIYLLTRSLPLTKKKFENLNYPILLVQDDITILYLLIFFIDVSYINLDLPCHDGR
jgi:hypothetical protein